MMQEVTERVRALMAALDKSRPKDDAMHDVTQANGKRASGGVLAVHDLPFCHLSFS